MKFAVEKEVLSNGLTVVRTALPTESVTVLLVVRVGSRDESKKLNGLSHFLEHMVFKGTKKWRTPMEMNRVIESVGGVFNAFTDKEYTGFWVKLSKKHLKLGLDYLHQAVFEPLLPKEELEKERGVILEEIKMYEDNPMWNVSRAFVSQMYDSTCLGRKVIGEAENIKRFERQHFDDYLKKWYQPGNMVLSIAGGGAEELDKATVAEIFNEPSMSGKSLADIPKAVETKQVKARVGVIEKRIEQAHFCLGLTSFKRQDKDRYVLGVMQTILGGNTSSRLWEEVREKRGLVYYIRTDTDTFYETGHLVTQAGCDVYRLKEAIKVVKGEYEKIRGKMISADELKRAKEYIKGRIDLSLEDSREVAGLFGEDLLLESRIRKVEEIKDEVEKITREDVLRVARRVMAGNKLNLTVLGPVKRKQTFEKYLK